MYSHFIGNNPGQCGLSQPRRPVEKYMVQRFFPLSGRFDINFQRFPGFFLSNILLQPLGPQTGLYFQVFFLNLGGNHTFFHERCSFLIKLSLCSTVHSANTKQVLLSTFLKDFPLNRYSSAICFKADFNTSSTVMSGVSSTLFTDFKASDEEYPSAVNA